MFSALKCEMCSELGVAEGNENDDDILHVFFPSHEPWCKYMWNVIIHCDNPMKSTRNVQFVCVNVMSFGQNF